jgi:hypothetical protein
MLNILTGCHGRTRALEKFMGRRGARRKNLQSFKASLVWIPKKLAQKLIEQCVAANGHQKSTVIKRIWT